MINRKRRVVSGLLSGALGLSAVAQEPAAPAKPAAPTEEAKAAEAMKPDPFKAPDNVAAAPEGAEKTASGLASMVLKKGTGTVNPSATDRVSVHYTGWKASDGEMFDSSLKRGQAAEFGLNQVIKGWTEGVQLMVEGEKRRFWIPSELAYGDNGRVAGNLTFDVELLAIVKAPKTPPLPKAKDAPENVAAAPDDAAKTESGIPFIVLQEGEGEPPKEGDYLKINFSGWSTEGVAVGSNKNMGQPMEFNLADSPIVGWREVMKDMKAGEKRRAWIPKDKTFVNKRSGVLEGDLTFDLELVSFKTPPPAPETPSDVAAVPENATVMESGLAYRVLKKGTGTKKPGPTDRVKVHYAGWTTDGNLFDNSIQRDQLFDVRMSGGVIDGWLEALKVMVEGEKTRFWIPAAMAYGDTPRRPGAPSGMLVFDIELFEIISPEPKKPKKKIQAVTPPIKVEPKAKEEAKGEAKEEAKEEGQPQAPENAAKKPADEVKEKAAE